MCTFKYLVIFHMFIFRKTFAEVLPAYICDVKVTTPLAKFLSANAHRTPQKLRNIFKYIFRTLNLLLAAVQSYDTV
jgi:hypothetical protein